MINLDWCREIVSTKVFRLRPETYKAKHPIWPGMVGIELEIMPFAASSLQSRNPKMTPLFGVDSLTSYLEHLQSHHPSWIPRRSQNGLISSMDLGDSDQFTFEPGGQLEFSTKPYPCLQDAGKRVRKIQESLNSHAAEFDIVFIQAGSHPWASAKEIGLQMSKQRYQAMDKYFKEIGPFGERMMRETCTIQVNLDFGSSENVLAKRYLAANLLAPIFTAIFANSPISEGVSNGYKSVRANIWRMLDPGRTGFPALTEIGNRLDLNSCVAAYLDHVLDAHVIFIESLNFQVPPEPLSFRQWMEQGYQGVFPTAQDFETHLTLHFPEVRPKGFLELRSIDCQGVAWQIVPASISASLLYDDDNLHKVIELLSPFQDRIDDLREQATKGLDNLVLREVATKIMYLAIEGFRRLPPCYQGEQAGKILEVFAEKFTLVHKTPADDILDHFAQSGGNFFTPDMMRQVQDSWLNLI